MGKIVSPAELEVLTASAAPARAAKDGAASRYNFRRPDRISKEQISALQFLHDRSARNMSTSFSAYLRTTIGLSVASIEQVSYGDFLDSLTDPTAFYALGIAPFDELGAVEINPSIAFALIDRMLGGTGQAATVNRPLTEIEQNVVDTVVKLLLEGLSEVWKPVSNLTFSIRARETRPQMLQVASASEAMIVVAFDVVVGGVRGRISIAIPSGIVETASAQFATMRDRQKQRRDLTPAERLWLHDALGRVTFEIVPQIRTELKTSAVLALQPGEVLALPRSADQPLDVYIGGARKLTGRLATDSGRLMVMVESRVAEPLAGAAGV